jgi:type I restriction enzyme, S subunit
VGIVREDSQAVFASYLVRLNANRKRVDPEFLNHWLNTPVAQRALKRLSTRGVSQANINPTEFKKHCPVPLPPLPEQGKISEILRAWDEASDRLEALRVAKSSRLTGLVQKLFGRGGAFPERWNLRPLSAISKRIRRLNGGTAHPVMTISARAGFLMQSEKFSRDMAGTSVERYIVLHEGEFAYNKGNSLTAPYGCIFPLDRPAALVPFVYFCFALTEELNRAIPISSRRARSITSSPG